MSDVNIYDIIRNLPEEKRERLRQIIAGAYRRNKDAIENDIIQELEPKIISILQEQERALDVQEISKLTDTEQYYVLMVLNKSQVIEKVITPLDETDRSVRYYVKS